ncbi:translocation/assembly module TamB domain-containing protein [Sphingobium aquiterrae]|uniref:translocation/assembly module TamB domain-containing protein n=1 Tax=Sphingobium aquiterrae TaxID=2038656 RepID=UPI00301AFEAE
MVDETPPSQETAVAREDAPVVARARRRWWRGGWQAWLLGGILALVLTVAGALLWLDTAPGHRFLAERIARIAPQSGLRIKVGRIDGSIYSKARLHDVELADPKGRFFSAPDVVLDWWPFAWFANRLDIDRLVIPQATLHRLPALRPTSSKGPILPDFDIRLMEFRIDRLTIEPPVTGRRQMATLRGDADIRSGRAIIDLSARTLDGDDSILLALDSRPDDNRFDVDVTLNAPKGGVIAAMAGLRQDANLRVEGQGSWQNWNGQAMASLEGKPALALKLAARAGHYRLSGTIEGAAIAGNGLIQRLSAPRLSVDGSGTFEKRVLDGVLKLHSDAIALDADGAIDLRAGSFDNLLLDLQLNRPAVLLKRSSGRDVLAKIRLDGLFHAPTFEYLMTARMLAFDKTVLSDVRASGKGHVADSPSGKGGPLIIPVALSAKRLDGQGDMVAGILRNFSLSGVLQLQDQRIVSNPMQVRADKLRGTLVAMADLKSGRYDMGLTGDVNGLAIPGLGIIDVRSKIQAVPGARGAFTLTGNARASVRRLDNAFFRTLGGGLPVLQSALSLGPDGRLNLTGLTLDAPLIALRANGYRRPDGSMHFEGGGTHKHYGAVQLTLDGRIDRPAVDLMLARPLDAAGLRNVHVTLIPDPRGYALSAAGGSTLGPFEGTGAILMPPAGQTVIQVDRLAMSGTTAHGNINVVPDGLDGRLDVTGAVAGFVALQPVGGIQQITADLQARDAQFDGPAVIAMRQGRITATVMLNPAGTSLEATVQMRGLQMGSMRIGRLAANARLVDGSGTVKASINGQRNRLIAMQMEADVTPERIRLNASGTLDRKPITLGRAAVFTRTEDGWRLAPATISYAGGTAQLAGELGGETTRIEARLNRLPLSLLDLMKDDLGLGGAITGSVSYAKPRGGVPTGTADVRIRNLTRSGLALSSTPIDLGINAVLTPERLAGRAVVVSQGKTIGRAQALLTPLGVGDLVPRLRSAPLFAQLRYDGTADTLWRLTGVEIVDLSGPVAIGADVRGTMTDPHIAGSMATDNATIESPITGMRLTGVKARGRFSGAQLVITSFAGTAKGGGAVSGTGRFEFATGNGGVAMDLAMQADNAALLERDDIAATVTGPITIRSNGVGGTIGGDVTLNRSRFTLGRAAAVAQIPELRVIEVNRRGEEFARAAPAAPWALAMKARARNRLMVDGLGLDSEWRADLTLGGTVVNPAITGTAELVRGGYEFAGRRFELREGRIRFQGETPVNPILDIEAEANLADLTATINVTGTGLKPIIGFTSVPALPEDELLSRILFGTSITNLSAPEALQLASAVAALQGGGGGLDPINAVRKAAGLDRLRIIAADPTNDQGTAIAAGKYITRKTYVELISDGAGYSATRIEYQITRWLALLASVSTLGRQSANVRISKDY